MHAPCCDEQFTIVVFGDIGWVDHVHLSARRTQYGLCRARIAGVERYAPHAHKDSEAKGSRTCHRRPTPWPPKQRKEPPPRRGREDAVAVELMPEPDHEILRVMTTDDSVRSWNLEPLKQGARNHGRQNRGPGTSNQGDERQPEAIFSFLEFRRTRDDDEARVPPSSRRFSHVHDPSRGQRWWRRRWWG